MDTLKAYFQAFFLKTVREGTEDDDGEGKFGLVPPSIDPNSMLNQPANSAKTSFEKLLRKHPLLSFTQQFSGIDRRLTADPAENEEAQELYPQLRNEHRLKLQQKQSKRQTPTLTR